MTFAPCWDDQHGYMLQQAALDDLSTADTGPAVSPASRQHRFCSSPFDAAGVGPLFEYTNITSAPAAAYVRRSRSEDQSAPPYLLESSASQSKLVDVSDAVASILNSPALLLALSQLDEQTSSHEPPSQLANHSQSLSQPLTAQSLTSSLTSSLTAQSLTSSLTAQSLTAQSLTAHASFGPPTALGAPCSAAELLASLLPALAQTEACATRGPSESPASVSTAAADLTAPGDEAGFSNAAALLSSMDDLLSPRPPTTDDSIFFEEDPLASVAWTAPDLSDQSALLPPGLAASSASDWSTTAAAPSPAAWSSTQLPPPALAFVPPKEEAQVWIKKAPSELNYWTDPPPFFHQSSPLHVPTGVTSQELHCPRDCSVDTSRNLLQDFRNGQVTLASLYNLRNQLFDFALDQAGARFIQQRLTCCPPQEAMFAREILLPKTKILVTDVFGNHIVQRLLETGTPAQRHQVFLQLKGDILRLALQTYGCRVLQKALETLSLDDKLAFVSELQAHVVRCVEDQNGNHVIQKCIERLPAQHIKFIIDAFRGQVARVSAHCYGCRVIQRVLEHCPTELIHNLLDEIMSRLVRLAQDQYGNYVIQHVLRYGRSHDKEAIVNRIANDLLLMSSHKFSSNVVEKCLELPATPNARRLVIRSAFGDPSDPRPPIMQMVRDRYANYVVQRMLDVTTQEDSDGLVYEVVARLERHMPALRKFTYGKHIAAALERLRKQTEENRRGDTAAH